MMTHTHTSAMHTSTLLHPQPCFHTLASRLAASRFVSVSRDVQTREGRPVLDPAMSNFDTLGRGWAWGLVALAILLGKTPATTTTKTKHQTPNLLTTPMTPPPHSTLCYAIATACCTMPRHAMPCYCYAMLCMEFYAKGCALTRVMCVVACILSLLLLLLDYCIGQRLARECFRSVKGSCSEGSEPMVTSGGPAVQTYTTTTKRLLALLVA
jgi:hypothetical protein